MSFCTSQGDFQAGKKLRKKSVAFSFIEVEVFFEIL